MGATYWLLPRMLGRELRFAAWRAMQPYLWFVGMTLFSTSYHIAGLRGLPRRVYSAALGGQTQGAAWHALTRWRPHRRRDPLRERAVFVLVVVATWTAGRRIEAPAFEFAVPLRAADGARHLGSFRPVDDRRGPAGRRGVRVSADAAARAPALRIAGVQAVLRP